MGTFSLNVPYLSTLIFCWQHCAVQMLVAKEEHSKLAIFSSQRKYRDWKKLFKRRLFAYTPLGHIVVSWKTLSRKQEYWALFYSVEFLNLTVVKFVKPGNDGSIFEMLDNKNLCSLGQRNIVITVVISSFVRVLKEQL